MIPHEIYTIGRVATARGSRFRYFAFDGYSLPVEESGPWRRLGDIQFNAVARYKYATWAGAGTPEYLL